MQWEIPSLWAASILAVIAIVGVILILRLSKDKTRKVSSLRLFVQTVALFAIFLGLIIGPFNQPLWLPLGPSPREHLLGTDFLGTQFPDGVTVPILACYFPNGLTVTCAIWQIQAYIFPFWNVGRGYDVFYSTTGLEKLLVVFGLLIGMSVVLGRFFCGWLCPFGLYMDLITRLRKVFKKRHLSFSDKINEALGQFRYIVIAVILILSVILGSYAIAGTELIPGTIPGGPFGTEAGIVGFLNEPFCLVCPMRPLCVLVGSGLGSLNWSYVAQITYGPFWVAGQYVTSLNLAILIIVTVLSFAYRRFWCRICPLGALTAIFSSFTPFKQVALMRLYKDEQKCTKCGICKRVCPTQATQVYEKKGGDATESRCMLCARCVELCPYDGALAFKFAGKTLMESRNWLDQKDADKIEA
jgi:ferredoxin-type protein NapH